MTSDVELWRKLHSGDRVRLVTLEFLRWPTLHPETKAAYRYLLRRRRPVVVCQIDEDGFPWVQFRRRDRHGRILREWMMVNHGGLAIVRPRSKKKH